MPHNRQIGTTKLAGPVISVRTTIGKYRYKFRGTRYFVMDIKSHTDTRWWYILFALSHTATRRTRLRPAPLSVARECQLIAEAESAMGNRERRFLSRTDSHTAVPPTRRRRTGQIDEREAGTGAFRRLRAQRTRSFLGFRVNFTERGDDLAEMLIDTVYRYAR